VETLIADLAALRAQMIPEVPRNRPDRDSKQNVSVQDNADMEVRLLRDGRIRFWIRNCGLGWLVFNLPVGPACAIRDYLIANTPEQPAGNNVFEEFGGGDASH
jgi:hypothetical protein